MIFQWKLSSKRMIFLWELFLNENQTETGPGGRQVEREPWKIDPSENKAKCEVQDGHDGVMVTLLGTLDKMIKMIKTIMMVKMMTLMGKRPLSPGKVYDEGTWPHGRPFARHCQWWWQEGVDLGKTVRTPCKGRGRQKPGREVHKQVAVSAVAPRN